MAGELEGKVAIVTGGASGIGRATAEAYVHEGARVMIADVDEGAGKEVADALGDAAAFQRTDVSDLDQLQALIDGTVDRFGGLHVMMNNAGIPDRTHVSFLEIDFDDFERIMAVNLLGVMAGSQLAARYMKDHGGGSIINTTSIAGIQPSGGATQYRAAKAGVVMFSKSIALEIGEFGIRVNCIAPGLIQTGMTTYDLAPVRGKLQPLDREGTVEDVANAAIYLASDRSAQVTGLVLPVDGGTAVGPPVRRRRVK